MEPFKSDTGREGWETLRQEFLAFYSRKEYTLLPEGMLPEGIPGVVTARAQEAMKHLDPEWKPYDGPSEMESQQLRDLEAKIRDLETPIGDLEAFVDLRQRLERDQSQVVAIPEDLAMAMIKEFLDLDRLRSERLGLITRIGWRNRTRAKGLVQRVMLHRLRGANHAVATTLRPLGVHTSAHLLYHGYLTAMMNLHSLMDGYPLLPLPTLRDFINLVEGTDTWSAIVARVRRQVSFAPDRVSDGT